MEEEKRRNGYSSYVRFCTFYRLTSLQIGRSRWILLSNFDDFLIGPTIFFFWFSVACSDFFYYVGILILWLVWWRRWSGSLLSDREVSSSSMQKWVYYSGLLYIWLSSIYDKWKAVETDAIRSKWRYAIHCIDMFTVNLFSPIQIFPIYLSILCRGNITVSFFLVYENPAVSCRKSS